ncbi:MAG: hypothetical protein EXS36_16675 [Pedosphaera sp.]|nr:hypothetical protein [Pedosphaera sp.]
MIRCVYWFRLQARRWGVSLASAVLIPLAAQSIASENVFIPGVPDYGWFYGCFGTATGNLIGFWDRHGLPDYYTGSAGDGVAPLDTFGENPPIVSLWVSKAGRDGLPLDRPGHADDYYLNYLSTAEDPYVTAGRKEHSPDCIGDFMGMNQRKWTNLNDECFGNLDGYSFNYFENTGIRRMNFTPPPLPSGPVPDIQSGLREFSGYRGYAADTFSQLTDFNPSAQIGLGFSFADLRAEIDGGYPVLVFMQDQSQLSRTIDGIGGVNPQIHAMLIYGYLVTDDGHQFVRCRTSWASGDLQFSEWLDGNWTPDGQLFLPARGVIGFHPHPRIRQVVPDSNGITLRWDGPMALVRDDLGERVSPVHYYVVERAARLEGPYKQASQPVAALESRVDSCCGGSAFFRVRLVSPPPE